MKGEDIEVCDPSNGSVPIYETLDEADRERSKILRDRYFHGKAEVLRTSEGKYWIYFAT